MKRTVPPARPALAIRTYMPSMAILLLGLTLSFIAFFGIRAWERNTIEARMEEEAARQASSFRKGIERQMETLLPIRSMYFALRGMEPYDFQDVVNAIMVQHPDIRALVWLQKVPDGVENRTGMYPNPFAKRISTGQLNWEGKTFRHYLDYYRGPKGADGPTLFLDLSTTSSLQGSLKYSRGHGMSIDTQGVELLENSDAPYGYSIVLPIIAGNPRGKTVPAEAGNQLLGFLVGIYRADFPDWGTVGTSGKSGVLIRIHDVTEPGKPLLVFSNLPPKEVSRFIPAGEHLERFEVGGRKFVFSFSPTVDYLSHQRNWVPWILLGGGFLLSIFCGAYLFISGRQAAEVGKLVTELSQTNAEMEKENEERRRAETSLVRSEKNFRLALEYAPFPIVVFGLERELFFVNGNFADATGYAMDRFPDAGLLFERLFRSGERADKLLSESIANGSPGGLAEHGLLEIGIDGLETREWEIRTSHLSTWDDKKAVMLVGNDVTDRKMLEQQLFQSQKMDAIGRLAGGIAHDINNYLGAISGFAELVTLKIDAGSDTARKMSAILEICGKAAGLIQQLLAYSRKQPARPEPVDASRTVENIQKLTRHLVGENIRMSTSFPPEPAIVHMDPSQLEQILVNLIVNARDAMPNGGSITLETRTVSLEKEYTEHKPITKPGRYVLIAVTDTGTGIPESIREKIFDPFFTTKGATNGTGLGLSTVYGIIKQNDGYIWVYSEIGVGTTFKIYLPVCEQGETSGSVAIAAKEEVMRGTGRILFVEDNDDLRGATAELLGKMGYEVLETATAEDAISIYDACGGRVDLLLTDVILPRMTGRELYERLGQSNPVLPALFISGYTGTAMNRHGILPSGVNFLQKPFSSRELGGEIREILNNAQAGTG